MKPKSKKPIPFLKEQQELAALFVPEEVSHYFKSDVSGPDAVEKSEAESLRCRQVEIGEIDVNAPD